MYNAENPEERRKVRKRFHPFRRSTDPSLWVPGIITIVGGAAIIWLVSEVVSIQDLRVAETQNAVWRGEHDKRVQSLEVTINGMLLRWPQKGMYMSTAAEVGFTKHGR